MADYIDREKIFSIWRSMPAPASVTSLAAAISQTPAADVVEVRHGRLYLAEDAVFRCSECGRICYELDAPYCYCGARMDKEANT